MSELHPDLTNVTITVSQKAADVAYDNLYERLREETTGDEIDWLDDPTARALMEVVEALRRAGASR